MLYLNAISLPEFLSVAPMYDVPEAKAVERYRIFGGVIRPGLTLSEATDQTLRNPVTEATALELLDLSFLGPRSAISHSLVHLRVSDSDDEDCSQLGMLEKSVMRVPRCKEVCLLNSPAHRCRDCVTFPAVHLTQHV